MMSPFELDWAAATEAAATPPDPWTTTLSKRLGYRTVGLATDLDLDPAGGRWVVICEDHYTIANVTSKKRAQATSTLEFCDGCRERKHTSAVTCPCPECRNR